MDHLHVSVTERRIMALEAELAVKEHQLAAQQRINRLAATLAAKEQQRHMPEAASLRETLLWKLREKAASPALERDNGGASAPQADYPWLSLSAPSHQSPSWRPHSFPAPTPATQGPQEPVPGPPAYDCTPAQRLLPPPPGPSGLAGADQWTPAVPTVKKPWRVRSEEDDVAVPSGSEPMGGEQQEQERLQRRTAMPGGKQRGVEWLLGLGVHLDQKEGQEGARLGEGSARKAGEVRRGGGRPSSAPSKRRSKKCSVEGCTKGAAPPAPVCISHGGGKRCKFPECGKTRRAPSEFCRRHGGGKRCQHEGCQKAAISAYAFCAKHGGGRRCLEPDCGKYAEPPTDRCKRHGGGSRCQVPGCLKSARRPTQFCSSHGGGKRCVFEGCGKAAVKNSFCWVHGGKEAKMQQDRQQQQYMIAVASAVSS